MNVLFFFVFVIVVLALIGLVLLQEGKGGGLTGNAAGMDSVMGARNPLRRWTVYFFIAFVVLVIGINKWYASRESAIPAGLDALPAGTGEPDAPPVPDGDVQGFAPESGGVPLPAAPGDGEAAPATDETEAPAEAAEEASAEEAPEAPAPPSEESPAESPAAPEALTPEAPAPEAPAATEAAE